MRGFLGCSPAYAEPCLGFSGDCGDLAEQFKDVPDSGIPDDYECTQFPDENSPRDKIIVGLICFAIGLPFSIIMEELFAVRRAQPASFRVRRPAPRQPALSLAARRSNEPECPEGQLTHPLPLTLLYGPPDWNFDTRPPSTFRLFAMRFAHEPKKVMPELVLHALELASASARRTLRAIAHSLCLGGARVAPRGGASPEWSRRGGGAGGDADPSVHRLALASGGVLEGVLGGASLGGGGRLRSDALLALARAAEGIEAQTLAQAVLEAHAPRCGATCAVLMYSLKGSWEPASGRVRLTKRYIDLPEGCAAPSRGGRDGAVLWANAAAAVVS